MTHRPFIKVREVAARCGVSEPTIRRLIRSNQLPATKVGQQYLITVEDLDEYLAKGRNAAGHQDASP